LFAWAASRFFVEARRTGELELLLTTPLGAEQVVAGQWRALEGLLLAPVLLIVLAVATRTILPALPLYLYYHWDPMWRVYMVCVSVWSMAYEVVALAALCWLGLWFGLKSPGEASALLRAIALGQVVPYLATWGGWLGVMPLRSVLFGAGSPLPFPNTVLPGTWLVSPALFGPSGPLPLPSTVLPGASLVSPALFGPSGPLPLAYSLVLWLPQLLVLLYFISLIRWARRRLRQELSGAEPAQFTLRGGPAPGSAGFQPGARGSSCAGRSPIP
jgi:hypothetical protein